MKNPISLKFSTQHAFSDRWSFQVSWSVSVYNEKYINLLLHSIGMRLKHLFQITDTIHILGNWKALCFKKVRGVTANYIKLSRLGSSEQFKKKKKICACSYWQTADGNNDITEWEYS